MDIFGSALLDEFNNGAADILWLHNTYDKPEEMPVDVFFRDESDIPELERCALLLCKGKILDIGAGVGSHALILQNRGFDVTALEISTTACTIMQSRGVQKIVNTDFFSFQNKKFDTLLMLMNGIGLAGKLDRLTNLLQQCKLLLKDDGQIIFDSSDISYLYDDGLLPQDKYFGEISYQYEYQGIKDAWFDWLYVDKTVMEGIAHQSGFKMDIIFEGEHDQYLARLTSLQK